MKHGPEISGGLSTREVRQKVDDVSRDLPQGERSKRREAPQLSLEQLAGIEDALREKGALASARDPVTGKQIVVADMALLADLGKEHFEKDIKVDGRQYSVGKRDVLFQLLGDQSGITKEQLAKEDYTEQPFLYIPRTARQATTDIGIKNARFHAPIWDLVGGNQNLTKEHPVREKEKETEALTELEARVALTIFHPKYGNAVRSSSDGALYITDPDTHEYVPFSWSALKKYGITWGTLLNDKAEERGFRHAMHEKLPNLVKFQSLRPEEDIRQKTMHEGEVTTYADIRRENKNGYVMIGRVNHFIGKGEGFLGKDIVVRQLSPTLAVIIDPSTEKITHTFRVWRKEDIQPTQKGYFLAGADMTQVIEISAKKFTHARREYETPEQYAARVHVIEEGLQFALRSMIESPELATTFENLGAEERMQFGEAVRFAEETSGGRDGFLALMNAFSHEEQAAKSVFSAYCELMTSADNIEEFVRSRMPCTGDECAAIAGKLRSSVLHRARTLLADAVRNHTPDVVKKLEHFSLDATLFSSAFRALKEQGDAELDAIAGASFERVDATDLTEEDKKQMRAIWESHYGQKYDEEYRATLREKFEETLGGRSSRFALYKNNEQIVNFSCATTERVDQKSVTHKHMTSFMSDKAHADGGLGLAVLERVIREESKDSVLMGECDTDPRVTPIVSKYFEDFGFVATRWYEDGKEKTPTFDVALEDGVEYPSKHMNKKEIAALAHAQSQGAVLCVRSEGAPPNFSRYINDSMVLTRYFVEQVRDQDDPKKTVPVYYAAFERSRASSSVRARAA